MASIPLPLDAGSTTTTVFQEDALQTALMEQFHIEIPVFPWPRGSGRCIRLSAQAYNQPEDYVRLAEALSAVL
jgi:isopenicillin-N epimerase